MVDYVHPDIIDNLQSNHARASFGIGIQGEPSLERTSGLASTWDRSDLASPQVFTNHPDINHPSAESAAGWPSLPGRPLGIPDYNETGAPAGGGY